MDSFFWTVQNAFVISLRRKICGNCCGATATGLHLFCQHMTKQHNPNLFPSGNEFGFVAYPDNISVYGKRSPPFLTGTIFVMYFPASGSIPHMPHALLYGTRFFCISYTAGEKILPFTGNLWYTSREAYRPPVQYHAYFLTGGLNGFCPAHLYIKTLRKRSDRNVTETQALPPAVRSIAAAQTKNGFQMGIEQTVNITIYQE